MIENIVASMSTKQCLMFLASVIGFYCAAFATYSLVQAIRRRQLVMEGQFCVGNALKVAAQGLSVPILVTMVGFACGFVIWIAQDRPRGYEQYWEPAGLLQVLTGLTILVQILFVSALAVGVIAAVMWVIYRYLCRPVGRGVVRTYHTVRPRIPVRW